MTILEQRVHNGVGYLNKRIPGWQEYVDTGMLDLSHEDLCILGQLAISLPSVFPRRTYVEARDFLQIGLDQAVDLGFTIPHDDSYEYDELTTTWVEVLR